MLLLSRSLSARLQTAEQTIQSTEHASLYGSEVTSVLDELIPACTVTIRRRPSDRWLDNECRQTKRDVRYGVWSGWLAFAGSRHT